MFIGLAVINQLILSRIPHELLGEISLGSLGQFSDLFPTNPSLKFLAASAPVPCTAAENSASGSGSTAGRPPRSKVTSRPAPTQMAGTEDC